MPGFISSCYQNAEVRMKLFVAGLSYKTAALR